MEERKSRRSIRLPQYDYGQPGSYFITICSHQRKCIFSKIVEGQVVLTLEGEEVQKGWLQVPRIYRGVELDAYVIMPNHIHGIVNVVRPLEKSLGFILGRFKIAVTKKIHSCLTNNKDPIFQRNYFEHIIRNEKDLFKIREYIQNNPLQWELDRNNPKFL